MWITYGRTGMSGGSIGVIIFFIAYQNIFILIMHLALTRCSAHIHRPGPLLAVALGRTAHPVGDLRTRLRLAHDLFATHTTRQNRYGFTYGNFGLVSLDAFVKVGIFFEDFIYI